MPRGTTPAQPTTNAAVLPARWPLPSIEPGRTRMGDTLPISFWAGSNEPTQVPDSHFGWYAPFCRCDNSTQDTSSQSGPNLGWQCVSQGVRKTSRCNARAFPAQSTDLFCALHLLLRQLQRFVLFCFVWLATLGMPVVAPGTAAGPFRRVAEAPFWVPSSPVVERGALSTEVPPHLKTR